MNPHLLDRTGTVTDRRLFIRDIKRRFTEFQREITRLIVTEDAFGYHDRGGTYNASECGAGEEGAPGFQPGNTCGAGSGGVTIKYSNETFREETNAKIRQVMGEDFKIEELADLVGAQPGATVEIDKVDVERGWVLVNTDHPDYISARLIHRDRIYNSSFDAVNPGLGVGTKVFYDQVQAAAARGMKTITTYAGRSSLMNGHYTWPRLGYDAAIYDVLDGETLEKVEKRFPGDSYISDIMSTKEGRDWWKQNGDGFDATFDLKENSHSRRILESYVKERASRAAAVTNRGGRGDLGRGVGAGEEITANIRAASTQVDIGDPVVLTQLMTIQRNLHDEDVLELEDEPHITIRFGLDDVGPDRVRYIIGQHRGAIRAKLGSLSLFQNGREDVLKVDVKSKDLDDINAHLGIIPNQSTHAQYVPHLTVAYMKPGAGIKYVGKSGLEGAEVAFRFVIYSDVDRDKTHIMLANEMVANAIWSFLSDSQKVDEFTEWARAQLSKTVLKKLKRVGQDDPDHWITQHIERVHKKALGRTFDAVKGGISKELYEGAKGQYLDQTLARPNIINRVKMLSGRTFRELEGVTRNMETQMQRTLVNGFLRGDSPYVIARALNKDVKKLGIDRAETIARTEISFAYNEGQLDGFEELGVEELGVAVEWTVSGIGKTKKGYPSPCKVCAPMAGVVFTLEEARGKLPRHPRCLCTWVVSNLGEDTSEQKRTRSKIQAAVDKSVKAESSKKSKRTLAQQRRRSTWQGATMKIAKKRPKSIF